MTGKNIFVTVGTTKFDTLIQTVTQEKILKTFVKLGYNNVTLQIGNGTFEPTSSKIMKLTYYRLKSSIKDDIKEADLVISHAGAGSCLEILNENKKLIAVINENLMGNHQMELAKALSERGYLKYCTCQDLEKTLSENFDDLLQYVKGDTTKFVQYLDKCVGFYD